MATDTTVNSLVINKLTKAQYDAIQTKSETELYLVPDEIDSTPTSGSDNPVKSGGVYSSLADKQDVIDSSHKLSADLIEDGSTNKVYTATEQTKLSGLSAVSGTNDGTNWTSITIGDTTKSVGVLPENVSYWESDNGEGIVPEDGIRAETVTSAATMSINPDVVTIIDGAVGTAAITLQVPNDSLSHVWNILMTTDSTVSITFAMSNSATIKAPKGFTSVSASTAIEIAVIGKGSTYYMRYGEFA